MDLHYRHNATMDLPGDFTAGDFAPEDFTTGDDLNPAGAKPYLEIIIPALNEEVRLAATLARTAAYLARQPYRSLITVVDNGSVDRTADLVAIDGHSRVPVRLIGCAERGKGAAVRRGILTSEARYIGFSDADGSTPIETLDAVVPALETGNPVVVASRRCAGAEYAVSQPLLRRAASRGFKRAGVACHPRLADISDTQCGFKFFETRAARHLFGASTASGFAFDVEILALSFMAGYGVLEVPVCWEHQDGSKLRVSGEATRVLRELIVMRRSLRSLTASGFGHAGASPLREEVGPGYGSPSIKVALSIADEAFTAAA